MPILRLIDSPSPIPRTDPQTGSPLPDQPPLPVWEAIIALIRAGNTHEDAALYTGISPSTLSVWIKRGLDEVTRATTAGQQEPAPTEELYVTLALEVARADAGARVGMVADWRRQMRRDWRAIDRFMAKRYAGPWADKTQVGVEMSGSVGVDVSIGAQPMSHAEAAAMRAELEARQAEIAALEAGDVLDVEEVPRETVT